MKTGFARALKVAVIGAGTVALAADGRGRPDGPAPVHLAAARPQMARIPHVAHAVRPIGRDRLTRRSGGAPLLGHHLRRQRLCDRDPILGAIADPSSLEQVAGSVAGRARRGITYLKDKLAALPPGDRKTPATATDIRQLIGSLDMCDGEWDRAAEQFALAQSGDPSRSVTFRANMEALQGVAALRRGEVENCVACCNESSCIFPLAADAVHRRPSGSRAAIAHFTRYLRDRPEDLGVQWLLNVAYMTIGEYPASVPPEFLLPLGRFAGAEDDRRRMRNIAARVGLNAAGESMAGGCMVNDFDGDGRLDVLMPTTDPGRGALLLRNRGDGTFEDVSAKAGLSGQVLSLNGCHADYDNDGGLDVLLLRGAWEVPRRMSLLRNRGGVFEDVTMAAGLGEPIATQAAGWADYDNDGRVNLYVAGEFDPAPRPAQPGPALPQPRRRHLRKRGGALRRHQRPLRQGGRLGRLRRRRPGRPLRRQPRPARRLYHNRGDGTFEDLATVLGVTEPNFGFACWFWDYDNDGRLDLWVNPNRATLSEVIRDQLGRPTSGDRPRLYRNVGGADLPRRHRGGRPGPRRPADGLELRRRRQRRLPRHLPRDRPTLVLLPDAQPAVPQRRRASVRGHHRGDGDRAPAEGAWRRLRRLGP